MRIIDNNDVFCHYLPWKEVAVSQQFDAYGLEF